MGRARELKVYRATYVFIRELYKAIQKLPKSLRYNLGSQTMDTALKMMKLIVVANGSQQKQKILKQLMLELDQLWVQLRLLYDLKGISKGEFKVYSERLSEISKQISGWFNWDRKRSNNQKQMVQ